MFLFKSASIKRYLYQDHLQRFSACFLQQLLNPLKKFISDPLIGGNSFAWISTRAPTPVPKLNGQFWFSIFFHPCWQFKYNPKHCWITFQSFRSFLSPMFPIKHSRPDPNLSHICHVCLTGWEKTELSWVRGCILISDALSRSWVLSLRPNSQGLSWLKLCLSACTFVGRGHVSASSKAFQSGLRRQWRVCSSQVPRPTENWLRSGCCIILTWKSSRNHGAMEDSGSETSWVGMLGF